MGELAASTVSGSPGLGLAWVRDPSDTPSLGQGEKKFKPFWFRSLKIFKLSVKVRKILRQL